MVKVKPGDWVVDPPTLTNLGFEWSIQGDDNRNATVDVAYRKLRATEWIPALPLLRLQGSESIRLKASSTLFHPTFSAAFWISIPTRPVRPGSR
jgi:hypothetical protein